MKAVGWDYSGKGFELWITTDGTSYWVNQVGGGWSLTAGPYKRLWRARLRFLLEMI